jgi:hypothetical protein
MQNENPPGRSLLKWTPSAAIFYRRRAEVKRAADLQVKLTKRAEANATPSAV